MNILKFFKRKLRPTPVSVPSGKHIGAMLDRICYDRNWGYRIYPDGTSLLIYEHSLDPGIKEIPKGFYNAGTLAGSVELAAKELGHV